MVYRTIPKMSRKGLYFPKALFEGLIYTEENLRFKMS